MKKFITLLFVALGILTIEAQETGYFYGGLESNSQWLQNDEGINFTELNARFRANNYLLLNYNQGNFTVGAQYESYLPSALLGYDPIFDGNNGIATYYANYKTKQLDVTAGYFYDQFGSGLIFRSWEDRQLGVNNAINGLNIKLDVTEDLTVKGIFGSQRHGFELSEGTIQGLDTDFSLSNSLKLDDIDVRLGGSYVARYQDNDGIQAIPKTVGAYGARLGIDYKSFYVDAEVILKDPDVIIFEGNIASNKLYDGTALLMNVGYAQKGFGVNSTFRRLENFSFFADRNAEGNAFNQQVVNYVPGLTKQQDYLLTNIYVYNPQPRLIIEQALQQAGEVGFQTDVFYTFEKGTFLGGENGAKIAANFAYWGGLDAEYNLENRWYEAEFIGSGNRLFRDFSLEIKKKLSKSWSTVLTYQNVIIDSGVVNSSPTGFSDISAQIAVAEATYKFNNGKSIRLVGQHLWSEDDRKNWAAGVVEFNYSSQLSFYIADNWNYGGLNEIHYYSVGGSYVKGNSRLGLNYGRQRGGLICVGGVCRFVPENTGLSANLTVAF